MTRPAVLLWLRRELRTHDNAALLAAAQSGHPVLPVFVLDDATPGPWALGGASRWWLHNSLVSLRAGLAQLRLGLLLRRGRADEVLAALAQETGAVAIHAGAAPEPWVRTVADRLAALPGVALHLHRTVTLFDLGSVRTQQGGPYGVFTPFARACMARGTPSPPLTPPAHVAAAPVPAGDRLEDWHLLPTRPDWAGGLRETWTPGEPGAARRLQQFVSRALGGYLVQRNIPASEGTSMLSPHLHWGEVSPRQVWHAVLQAEGGHDPAPYLNELLWREFSANLLFEHATLPDAPLRPEFARMPWRDDARALAAWQRGRTGVPIVDAGMRQLWQTGWMHNRVRMIVGSFLIKHLLLSWQAGEAWFWDTLVDADLATNAASWQWVAGSGADAAPFFRVFNPVLQGRKFDPDGAYVRRFVPELAGLADRDLHAPWEADPQRLAQGGVALGRDYPLPIVDLADGRNRALDAFRGLGRGLGRAT